MNPHSRRPARRIFVARVACTWTTSRWWSRTEVVSGRARFFAALRMTAIPNCRLPIAHLPTAYCLLPTCLLPTVEVVLQRRLGGVVAAHAVNSCARWCGGGTQIQLRR